MRIPNEGLKLLSRIAEKVSRWQEEFERYVEDVCASGLVKELYLVGSRARGDYSSSSDFDLLAIVGGEVDPLEVAEKLRLMRRGSFPLDLLVLTEEVVEEPIYSEMMRYGKKLC